MSINQMFAERIRKQVANRATQTEREWALSQPTEWQYACLAFAVASNTQGGVVGKSMRRIVYEANEAGIPVKLRSFERRIPVLQAHGIIYKDEKRPVRQPDGTYAERPSTWILYLDRVMPRGIPVTSPERWHNMKPTEWMNAHPWMLAPAWKDDRPKTLPDFFRVPDTRTAEEYSPVNTGRDMVRATDADDVTSRILLPI